MVDTDEGEQLRGVDRAPALLRDSIGLKAIAKPATLEPAPLLDALSQAYGGAGGSDRIGPLEVDPVLSREVEEDEQRLGGADHLGHRLRTLREVPPSAGRGLR